MQENFTAYALLGDLERWLPIADDAYPDWINDNKDTIDPFIKRAEGLILQGEKVEFDPHHPVQLTSIFNEIELKGEESRIPTKTFPFKPLSLVKEDIFPNDTNGDFEKLQRSFWEEFVNLPGGQNHPKIFTESLYYLLKKYTSCIPVSEHQTYLPLFEFLKIRAAIARSLYQASLVDATSDFPLQLYGIDQSGIQKFLYNISSNKAAKSLKGRSFYLQMLMESITQSILTHPDLGAHMVNVLYASGGKMYWILPNTADVNRALRFLEAKWLEQLYEAHRLEMYLAFASVNFGWDEHDIVPEENEQGENLTGLSRLWMLLGERIKEKGRQAYRQLMDDQFSTFFQPNDLDGFDTGAGAEKQTCAVTGETVVLEGTGERKIREKYDMLYHRSNPDDGERIWVNENVKRQVDLGHQLQLVNFYKTFYPEKYITDNHRERLFNPLDLEVYHGMAGADELKDEYASLNALPSFNFAIIKKINGPVNFLPNEKQNLPAGHQSAYGFIFYGGNRLAVDQALLQKNRSDRKAVKDFTQLAGLAGEGDKHKGFHRLGVLRMDVDGLGKIFREGMRNVQGFPTYAAISSQLDLFFSGYLNTIREASDERRSHMNIIYSGGDDIFAVGRWDILLDFAEEVRNEFREFVNAREEISISAGLVLVGPKFPIAKAARLAGEAEDAAKDFKQPDRAAREDKNSICLFDVPISWEGEFAKVRSLKQTLVNLKASGEITSGFIQRMIDFQNVKNQFQRTPGLEQSAQENGLPQDYSFLWNSAYYISRYEGRFKRTSDQVPIRQFLSQLKFEFLSAIKNDGRFYDLLGVAARWAELEIRSEQDA